MSAIKILKVGASKDWTGDHGTFRIYDVTFESGEQSGQGQVKKKVDSPPPSEGETFEGTIVDKGAFPPELKRAQQASNSGGGGGHARSPEKEAEITRMHSQEMAIRWAAVLQAGGQWPSDASAEDRKATLVKLIDFFEADAGKKAA